MAQELLPRPLTWLSAGVSPLQAMGLRASEIYWLETSPFQSISEVGVIVLRKLVPGATSHSLSNVPS